MSNTVELAVRLYGQALLSPKASELAVLSRSRLAELVGERGIPRHYAPEELAEDTGYARGR